MAIVVAAMMNIFIKAPASHRSLFKQVSRPSAVLLFHGLSALPVTEEPLDLVLKKQCLRTTDK